MAMGVERWQWFVAVLGGLLIVTALPAQSILRRTVTVQAGNVRLARALELVALDGGFRLSYNSRILPEDSLVSVNAQGGRVDEVMRGLLPEAIIMRESGEHLILARRTEDRTRHPLSGQVMDAHTGVPLGRVSVVEVRRSNGVTTGPSGRFELTLKGEEEGAALLFSRVGYLDTVVFPGHMGQELLVAIRPREKVERLEPICLHDRCGVEDLGVARLLVPAGQFDQAANLGFVRRAPWQVTLVPGVGTNGEVGAATVNTFSFNVFCGFARGVEGAEIGLGLNIDTRDVRGVQLAGLANLVGREVHGAQISGGINHAMRSLQGLQLGGFANVVWDTLAGVQIAGGANVAKGRMRGPQVCGGVNVALSDVDGSQTSGGANVALGDVRKAQFSGGFNFGRNIEGVQFTLGMNAALGTVGGGQIGFGANYAREVTGGQFSFGVNAVSGTVRGGQVGAVNFALRSEGSQVGFINLSDTITGVSIGVLSVALHGYHRLDAISTDVLPLTLSLRTGTRAFHNILGWSPPVGEDSTWAFHYGIGTEPRIGRRGLLDIALIAEQVNEGWYWVDAVNIVGRLELIYGYAFWDRLVVSAGPVLNVLISNWRDPDTHAWLSALAADRAFDQQEHTDLLTRAWVGWRAGVGVRF